MTYFFKKKITLKEKIKNTLKEIFPYNIGMEIYKNLFNYMENLIKQLENKQIIKAIIRDIQRETTIKPSLIDIEYIDSLLQQLDEVILPRSINHRTIKNIIEDIEKTNITPNKINYEHIESLIQQLEACMSTDEKDEEDEELMISCCEFIEEVPYNPLLLMPYHNQQLIKLEKLIADRIYQYKSELLLKQKMVNIDMANHFVITIFKIFYAFKNKEISYLTASILVNQYISDKIQQIEIIEHIEKIPSRECNIYIAPPIKPNTQHERNKESKRKYYEKNKEKFKEYARQKYSKNNNSK